MGIKIKKRLSLIISIIALFVSFYALDIATESDDLKENQALLKKTNELMVLLHEVDQLKYEEQDLYFDLFAIYGENPSLTEIYKESYESDRRYFENLNKEQAKKSRLLDRIIYKHGGFDIEYVQALIEFTKLEKRYAQSSIDQLAHKVERLEKSLNSPK